MSMGENICFQVLKKMKLSPISEYKIYRDRVYKKRYDFYFYFQNKKHVLEFDGIQHFQFVKFFHKNVDNFEKSKNIDILKTLVAIEENYKIGRIDYQKINSIDREIHNFLQSRNEFYFSCKTKYDFIIKNMD
jgi:hypothetical protein